MSILNDVSTLLQPILQKTAPSATVGGAVTTSLAIARSLRQGDNNTIGRQMTNIWNNLAGGLASTIMYFSGASEAINNKYVIPAGLERPEEYIGAALTGVVAGGVLNTIGQTVTSPGGLSEGQPMKAIYGGLIGAASTPAVYAVIDFLGR